MLGDLIYGNNPGGSGLTSDAMFGWRAGVVEAKIAGVRPW